MSRCIVNSTHRVHRVHTLPKAVHYDPVASLPMYMTNANVGINSQNI